MDRQTFINLPIEEAARLVQLAGTQTCVFPINGTRRWFMLEHMPESPEDFWPAYMDIAGKRHVELYRMMFDHGITYLLSPIFGPDILDRDNEYMVEMALPGIERLVSHPDFLDFYESYEVQVHFYGDYHKYFKPELADVLDSITERTRRYGKRHLFYGTFANDATETIAELAIRYHSQHGKVPDKPTLVELYYGERVPPVNLFIGFGKFSSYDMPLVATGFEDLYFMISPTPYLNERALRDILYDHVYSRQDEEGDYETLTQADRDQMQAFFHANKKSTLGIGEKHEQWQFWVRVIGGGQDRQGEFMSVRERLVDLLSGMGAGYMTSSAYDTAWVARLGDISPDLSEPALDWLRANQLPDGSWGAADLEYHHERLICTVAAINALACCGKRRDAERIQRGKATLSRWMSGFVNDFAGATIGFELLIPTLLDESKALGLINGNVNNLLYEYAAQRIVKLSRLPNNAINRQVTVAFSSELVGMGSMSLLDIDSLQEINGSVAYSPAATAFFALHAKPGDPAALSYLRQVAQEGGAPNNTPIDVFEMAWTLWNMLQIGPPDDELRALAEPHLDALEAAWLPGEGVGACSGFSLIDGDDTALVSEVLARFGRQIDLKAIQHYEADGHFICFPMESNPSIDTNIHILGTLRAAGFEVDHPSVQKVITFLRGSRRHGAYWFDKWHASPYYPTSHAIIALAGYEDRAAENAIRWLIDTQAQDGSWGFFIPTAEETAYSLQALLAWKRAGHHVPGDVIERGAEWLAARSEPPYPMLWIGKSLYCPREVVRGAILSALYCVEEEHIAS